MLYLLNNKECMCTYVQLHIYDVIHFALNIHPLNSIHEFLVLRPPPHFTTTCTVRCEKL